MVRSFSFWSLSSFFFPLTLCTSANGVTRHKSCGLS